MLERSDNPPRKVVPDTGDETPLLGVDTGGTYTDAVLFAERSGVIAKAKSLTTRHDLSEGIAEAAGAVIRQAATGSARIGLVSVSTTLATNALVEGQGGRVALVLIGFEDRDVDRDGLRKALGNDPLVLCPGGHDVHGNARSLDLEPLRTSLKELAGEVTGFAVAGYFAVRNPAHEIAACDLIQTTTGLPVTCSHELSSKLGGPRRALTTLLNARLIPMIDSLIDATRRFMDHIGIEAPLMVVRGDGALIASDMAAKKPIETILSGPAASIVGARYLTGLDNAVVSDIGGTTTDIAVLDGGRPRLDPDGAVVGGHRTMVEAVAMRTFGLGGDSEVRLEEGALDPAIILGPRRMVPLALASAKYPKQVTDVLERQLRASNPGRLDGLLVIRTGLPEQYATGLAAAEAKLYAAISDEPAALDSILSSIAQSATMYRLVARGLVHLIGFTPSDAAHVLGRQGNWDEHAAELGAQLFARRRNGRGQPVAFSAVEISGRVLTNITRRTAELVFQTAFDEDGLDGSSMIENPLVQRALDKADGIARNRLSLDRAIVGLGASAPLHYEGLASMAGNECIIPADTDVANAVGAVAGQVRVSVTALVSQPQEGLFRVSVAGEVHNFTSENEAMDYADEKLRISAVAMAKEAGTDTAEIDYRRDIRVATIEGQRMFVEATVVASASGRPRIAV